MTDEATIAALYERYGHALYRRCLSLVSNPDDANELVQEVFLSFWKNRDRFEKRSSPFTYLYRIATNQSIDRLRRRKTAGVHIEFESSKPLSNPGRIPEEALSSAEELAELTRGLDEDIITVAVMAHVDGLIQDEIAEALGVSRRTVGKRLKKFISHARGRAEMLENERKKLDGGSESDG